MDGKHWKVRYRDQYRVSAIDTNLSSYPFLPDDTFVVMLEMFDWCGFVWKLCCDSL